MRVNVDVASDIHPFNCYGDVNMKLLHFVLYRKE